MGEKALNKIQLWKELVSFNYKTITLVGDEDITADKMILWHRGSHRESVA